jgi:acyl-[acyl-carrier-protein]-phospholipid O-acyltransferase/long-chain-fatty-acid--[acyl-carrier-protein] ligase
VAIDGDGFVAIKGRAKRFAKIAGEMVSLTQVETLAAAVWPEAQHAVVALPDPRKGEQLVLLTTQTGAERGALTAHANQTGVTALAVPAHIMVVDKIPVLGSGKTDYVAVRALAEDRLKKAA